MVVELESDLIPLRLLKRLNAIETEMGRERKEKWGPRTIDIDILSIEGIVCNKDDRLNLPHPQLAKRRFVLQPWYEITPDYWVIGIGLTVTQLMQRCKDDSKVRLFLTARAWQEQMQKDKM